MQPLEPKPSICELAIQALKDFQNKTETELESVAKKCAYYEETLMTEALEANATAAEKAQLLLDSRRCEVRKTVARLMQQAEEGVSTALGSSRAAAEFCEKVRGNLSKKG